jgi:hypothetical protein
MYNVFHYHPSQPTHHASQFPPRLPTPLINATRLNNETRNYLIEKADSSLLFIPILPTNFKTSNALLKRLIYLL